MFEKIYPNGIIKSAKNYLKDDGSLFIVVRKEQGAKSMIRDLEEIYKVEILNKVKGFFVIKCNLGWLVDENMLII